MQKKRATILDIARELGISDATVSRALSKDKKVSALVTEETQRRVRQKAAELDYRLNLLAQGFTTGKTRTLGLLTYQIGLETFGRLTEQILRAADQQKYQIVMGMTVKRAGLDGLTGQIEQMISRGVDGLLINTRGEEEESELILNAVQDQVPVVTFYYPIANLSGVVLDDMTGHREATEHLIRLGPERIVFLGTAWNDPSPIAAKAKGYLQAMQKHGLTPQCIGVATGLAESGYDLGKDLGDQFTAFMCRDDYTAIGVCHGLRDLGLRVPEEVAVVGQGDMDVAAHVTPALTTLATPYEAIAQMAMELMLAQLEGQQTLRQITLKSPLIVRESCGADRPR